jgi:hypothetical protein
LTSQSRRNVCAVPSAWSGIALPDASTGVYAVPLMLGQPSSVGAGETALPAREVVLDGGVLVVLVALVPVGAAVWCGSVAGADGDDGADDVVAGSLCASGVRARLHY